MTRRLVVIMLATSLAALTAAVLAVAAGGDWK